MSSDVLALGQPLLVRRVNAGLTVVEAARRMGVDRRTLEKAERGESIRPPQAKRIAEFWDGQATDLLPESEAA